MVKKFDETYRLIYLCDSLEDYESEIEKYSNIIMTDSTSAIAYNNRGVLYREIGEFELALPDLDRSITLNPKSHYPYLTKAEILEKMGDLNGALSELELAAKNASKDATIVRRKAHLLRDMQRFDAAILEFSKAIKMEPNFAYTYFERGELNKLLGKLEDSKADLKMYQKLKN